MTSATIDQLKELQAICRLAYTQVFADHWTGNGLELYLEQEFGDDRMRADLNDPQRAYYFIRDGETTIGFIKMNYQSSAELAEHSNCELDKIYILPAHGGQGFGKRALREVISIARGKAKELLFLCVIDTNDSAIAFYRKMGFEPHSRTRLEVPLFKEELRGMERMVLRLKPSEAQTTNPSLDE